MSAQTFKNYNGLSSDRPHLFFACDRNGTSRLYTSAVGHEETLASRESCRAKRPVHPRQPTFMRGVDRAADTWPGSDIADRKGQLGLIDLVDGVLIGDISNYRLILLRLEAEGKGRA